MKRFKKLMTFGYWIGSCQTIDQLNNLSNRIELFYTEIPLNLKRYLMLKKCLLTMEG